jgi:ribosomal protein L11 methyltransferase
MEWRQFVMRLESLPADAVEAVLTRHGAQAITLTDAADEPVLEPPPGETPLWEQVCITGLFSPSTDFPALERDLLSSFGLASLPDWHVETLEDRAWEREWLKDFRPMRFGRRLWVVPDGQPVPAKDALILRLDPGLAFGTGTHPTTRLCLEWLEGLSLAQLQVLDFGCGSGILSIAAALLGAHAILALDIDPQALIATRSNALQNGVADRIRTCGDLASMNGEFDVVVANILAGTLELNASTICGRLKTGGAIALAGILDHQVTDVAGAYREWSDFDAPASDGEWVRLTGTRRQACIPNVLNA